MRWQMDAKTIRTGLRAGWAGWGARLSASLGRTRSAVDGWGRDMRSFNSLFRPKHYAGPDDIFFAVEDLPFMGKEYWFMHFCSPTQDEQVVLTAGRSLDAVDVNGARVGRAHALPARSGAAGKGERARAAAKGGRAGAGGGGAGTHAPLEGPIDMAAVCWMHAGGERRALIQSRAQVSARRAGAAGTENTLTVRGEGNEMAVRGAYPRYDVRVRQGGREVFQARAHPPKKGEAHEIIHMLRTPLAPRLGALMVNDYFEFEGKLQGRPFEGKAYLQKVVAVMPLLPWNWARVHFASGAAIDFFGAKGIPHQVPRQAREIVSRDYIEIGGKRHRLRGLRLEGWHAGERRRWLLSGPDFYLALESYALQPFAMRTRSAFQYDEYLVRVADFAARVDGRLLTLEDLGEGRGIVEDTAGVLV